MTQTSALTRKRSFLRSVLLLGVGIVLAGAAGGQLLADDAAVDVAAAGSVVNGAVRDGAAIDGQAIDASSFISVPQQQQAFLTDMSGNALDEVVERIFFSMSARARPEFQNNTTDFASDTNDEVEFVSARFRIGLGAELPGNTTLFMELQNNSFWGDDEPFFDADAVGDEDDVKFYQGYVQVDELFDTNFGFKMGRQELVYGTQLLLGNNEFNTGLSHDAVKVYYEGENLSVDAFWSKLVEAELADPTDEDADLWGVYTQWEGQPGTGLDLYWLFTRDARNGFDDKRHSLGVRAYTRLADMLNLNGEAVWQFGDTGATDTNIRAFAIETTAELDLREQLPLDPRIEVGYALATGDPDPTDSRAETFNPLFQYNHERLGYADLLFLTNLHALHAKGTVQVHENYSLGAAFYLFYVHRTADTTQPAGFSPGTDPTSSKYVGSELDVFLNFQCTKNVYGQLAWAHFFTGGYTSAQFGHSHADANRLYLHLIVAF